MPEFPFIDVPVLKINRPLAPDSPALLPTNAIAPLLVMVPSPDETRTLPPLATVLRPEASIADPPCPLVPLPIERQPQPPHPTTLGPEPMAIIPEFPDMLLPELKKSKPLSPLIPALDVMTSTCPLLVAVPSPEKSLTFPPVATADLPLVSESPLAAPLVPLPTLRRMAPPRPSVEIAVPVTIDPLFPLFEDPELKVRHPLVPTTPPFDVDTKTQPLLDAVPSPLPIVIDPPDTGKPRPDTIAMSAPVPLVPLPTTKYAAPLRPDDAKPVPKSIEPEFPDMADPELKTSLQLPPAVYELLVCSDTMPELEVVPSPVSITTYPPVFDAL